jgi:hypothetical protein
VHEVGAGERPPAGHTAATLGLGLEEGKAILAAGQRHLVAAQVEEHCRSRRRCDRCGAQRPLKDRRPRSLISLFGVVAVRAPRFGPCRCGVACRCSLAPAAEVMPDRCMPEYERAVAAMGAALPYRRALTLLGAFFPLGKAPPRGRDGTAAGDAGRRAARAHDAGAAADGTAPTDGVVGGGVGRRPSFAPSLRNRQPSGECPC